MEKSTMPESLKNLILIVEDDPIFRQGNSKFLSIRFSSIKIPGLPEMNGFELTKRIMSLTASTTSATRKIFNKRISYHPVILSSYNLRSGG